MATAAIEARPRSISSKVWREIARPFRRRADKLAPPKKVVKPAPRPAPSLLAFDPQNCTVEREGLELLMRLAGEAAPHDGPIIEIGTLLGVTATHMALAKPPGQQVITVDKYCWNPWGLPDNQHYALARQVLYYLIERGDVVQIRQDKAEFYASYAGARPSLVFLDAIHTYEETKKDIEWALAIGAKVIAGHDYSAAFPGVMQAVDEFGGPAELSGTVWRLAANAALGGRAGEAAGRTKDGAEKAVTTQTGVVSIIVPTYNARQYIGLALDDIARQTYGHWELIVVEDGSREPVEDIVRQFGRQHPEHRVVYQYKAKNTGVSNTRNVAMSLARGEYIAFLDADDRWQPQHLQRKVQYLANKNADLAYSRVEMFDSETERIMCVWGARQPDLDSFPESMFRGPYMQPSGVVLRQSLVRDVGGFDESLAYGEDYEFFLRALERGKRFVFDEVVTSRYRKTHDSAATTDRMVLCYEGTARVTRKYLDAPLGSRERRQRLVAKSFLKAGCGHLAFAPTKRNGCDPEKGKELLLEAWRLRSYRVDYLGYYLLACVANAMGWQSRFRRFFGRRVKP